ncbi:MAG TPA: AsnC family transcriptional regulator [Lachnospiraceae bacterium]|nr:AsnC family transcriptional regulator [Lachnospiraceae bacterium]
MDNKDKQILEILQKNARTPLKIIAKEVSLSSPAVSSRIEHMEQSGIITDYRVRVNREKLGFHITAFINLEMQPNQKPEFYPFIKNEPNVLECNCVTGEYSMLLKVTFPSTVDLDEFIGRLQHFGRTSTQIVFSTPVEPRGIPIPEQD